MYSRSYSEDKATILVPESYGGTALYEDVHTSVENDTETDQIEYTETGSIGIDTAAKDNLDAPKATEAGLFSGFMSKLPFGNIFGNFFGNGKFGLQKIGTEEILIIATAAFLFFSSDGDRECAILLLLLLFIN